MKKKNRFNRLILAPFVMIELLAKRLARIGGLIAQGFRQQAQYLAQLHTAVGQVDHDNPPTFEEVLDRWGIPQDEVKLRIVRLRFGEVGLWIMVAVGILFILTGLGVVGPEDDFIAGLIGSRAPYSFTGLVIISVTMLHISIFRWRKKILETKAFTPFAAWLWR